MSQYIQKGKYEATELEGEWIILNTEQYTVTRLNDVGGLCWSLLTEAQTSESLTRSLAKKYSSGKNDEQIKKDVEEFLINLVQCGLVQSVD